MRKHSLVHDQSGETLVEVLLATVILAFIVAGAYTMASRSLRVNQQATEKTEVVNKIREQVELINDLSISNRGSVAWAEVVSNATVNQAFYVNFAADPLDPGATAISTSSSDYIQDYDPGSEVDSYGPSGVLDIFNIWVEPDAVGNDYYQFKVLAEWDALGGGQESAGAVLRVTQ